MPASRLFLAVLFALALSLPARASGTFFPRDGWISYQTHHRYADLVERLDRSVTAHQMNLVNMASASDGARAQGNVIPGNRVVGVFRNDFARRMLSASLAAGIEAPIRFYLTENADGTGTLSYRKPTSVFRPYFEDGGAALEALAAELDPIFDSIARDASKD